MTIRILKKNIPSLKKKLWHLVSEYIRRKDANLDGYTECITCGKVAHWKEMDCGHYKKAGSSGLYLYFDERNLGVQCTSCNRFKGGAMDKYAIYLEKKYGNGILQEFDRLHGKPMPQAHFWLETKIQEYKKKLEEIPYLHGSFPGHESVIARTLKNRRGL